MFALLVCLCAGCVHMGPHLRNQLNAEDPNMEKLMPFHWRNAGNMMHSCAALIVAHMFMVWGSHLNLSWLVFIWFVPQLGEPEQFNTFLRKLKDDLQQNFKKGFWQEIVKGMYINEINYHISSNKCPSPNKNDLLTFCFQYSIRNSLKLCKEYIFLFCLFFNVSLYVLGTRCVFLVFIINTSFENCVY